MPTTEGTSTTQHWGKEPNVHVEITRGTAQTAKRAASIFGKAFRQDGVGIHGPASAAEDVAASAAIKANALLPKGSHRSLSVKKTNGSVWTQPEINGINTAARRYSVKLQTTPDGKGIEFHDYHSARQGDPVKASQDWQKRVAKATDKAGLRDKNKYIQDITLDKSQYVDKSEYEKYLGGNGKRPEGQSDAVAALARRHQKAFGPLTRK